jgi:hypothetical protein
MSVPKNSFSSRRRRIANILVAANDTVSDLEWKVLSLCNCRVATAFHNFRCLEAILLAQDIPCPVHVVRALGIFFRFSAAEPVLHYDRPFCNCQTAVLSHYSGRHGHLPDNEEEMSMQIELITNYFRSPGTKYDPKYAYADMLRKVPRQEDGKFDFHSMTADEKRVFILACRYFQERTKRIAETGKGIEDSFTMLKLFGSKMRLPTEVPENA